MSTSGNNAAGSNDGGKTVAKTIDKASTRAHNVIDRVSEAAHPAMDRLSSGAHSTVDRAASAATLTTAAFVEKREQMRYVRVRAMEQTRGYVRANPVTSIGIAVAVGFLLSRLMRTRA
jgi:ElaB/YqjD/DUF883 family membrane-anchored ribosome-binding protein